MDAKKELEKKLINRKLKPEARSLSYRHSCLLACDNLQLLAVKLKKKLLRSMKLPAKLVRVLLIVKIGNGCSRALFIEGRQ